MNITIQLPFSISMAILVCDLTLVPVPKNFRSWYDLTLVMTGFVDFMALALRSWHRSWDINSSIRRDVHECSTAISEQFLIYIELRRAWFSDIRIFALNDFLFDGLFDFVYSDSTGWLWSQHFLIRIWRGVLRHCYRGKVLGPCIVIRKKTTMLRERLDSKDDLHVVKIDARSSTLVWRWHTFAIMPHYNGSNHCNYAMNVSIDILY